MNRSWITALSLATVAGSGGAFATVVANGNDTPAAAQAEAAAPAIKAALVQIEPSPTRTVSYLVGAAGTVTLTEANGSLTIASSTPGSGWSVANGSGPGTHVEVQLTDAMQLVTFGADVAGDQIVVSVTNVAVPQLATAGTTESVTVPVVKQVTPTTPATVAPVAPATPPATAAPVAAQVPTPSATTAPSGSGDDSNKGDDDHESESNDD